MNRTIKDATVKRYHYDSHRQISTYLGDFIMAYNFAKRLKTLNGLTPYEYICQLGPQSRSALDLTHSINAGTKYFLLQQARIDDWRSE